MLRYDFSVSNGADFLKKLHEDSLVSVDQLAAILGVSEITVRKWRSESGLASVRLGKRTIRFRWGDVVDWLNKFQ